MERPGKKYRIPIGYVLSFVLRHLCFGLYGFGFQTVIVLGGKKVG